MNKVKKLLHHLSLKLQYNQQKTVGDAIEFCFKNKFPPQSSQVLNHALGFKITLDERYEKNQKKIMEAIVQTFRDMIEWGLKPSLKKDKDLVLNFFSYCESMDKQVKEQILDSWLNYCKDYFSPNDFKKYLNKIENLDVYIYQKSVLGFEKEILNKGISKYKILNEMHNLNEIVQTSSETTMIKKIKML